MILYPDVYEEVAKAIKSLGKLEYNGSMFIFGLSGCGKTHMIEQALAANKVPNLNVHRFDGIVHCCDATAKVDETVKFQDPSIVIIDNVHVFLYLKRQTFLYKVLDWVSSACWDGSKTKHGRLMIGISSRLDCLRSMEKRVLSRCSNRTINLPIPRPENIDKLMAERYGENILDDKNFRSRLTYAINLHGNDLKHLFGELDNYEKPKIASWIESSLDDLPIIELMLLIVTKRLEEAFKMVSFSDVYQEYTNQFGVAVGVQTPRYYSKTVIRALFNRLIQRRLIVSDANYGKLLRIAEDDQAQFTVQATWKQIQKRTSTNTPLEIAEYASSGLRCS